MQGGPQAGHAGGVPRLVMQGGSPGWPCRGVRRLAMQGVPRLLMQGGPRLAMQGVPRLAMQVAKAGMGLPGNRDGDNLVNQCSFLSNRRRGYGHVWGYIRKGGHGRKGEQSMGTSKTQECGRSVEGWSVQCLREDRPCYSVHEI